MVQTLSELHFEICSFCFAIFPSVMFTNWFSNEDKREGKWPFTWATLNKWRPTPKRSSVMRAETISATAVELTPYIAFIYFENYEFKWNRFCDADDGTDRFTHQNAERHIKLRLGNKIRIMKYRYIRLNHQRKS